MQSQDPKKTPSNRAKRAARSRQQKPVLIAFSVTLIMVLCVFALILLSMIADHFITSGPDGIPPVESGSESGTESATESETESEAIGDTYHKVSYPASAVKEGSLILINTTHSYDPELAKPDSMKSIYGALNGTFGLLGDTLILKEDALDALVSMMADFHTAMKQLYPTEEVYRPVFVSAFRTLADQTGKDPGPGMSDYHSGYTVGSNSTFAKSKYFSWVADNAYRYGYVIRYPEEKASITKMVGCTYILRYVGYPHAYYMSEHNLCMEEYLELLKTYSPEDRLTFTGDDGLTYEIYYVPAAGDVTTVRVPSGKHYQVSGNNDGGLIVTLYSN